MDVQEVLALLGGEPAVREYLRGIEEGSEADKDAQRSMLAAIESMRAAGVYDVMAKVNPGLYAQACLLLCRLWSDAEDADEASITRQHNSIVLKLRYHEANVK